MSLFDNGETKKISFLISLERGSGIYENCNKIIHPYRVKETSKKIAVELLKKFCLEISSVEHEL